MGIWGQTMRIYDEHLNKESAAYVESTGHSDSLIVVFSPINLPRGKFGLSRFFKKRIENILFINSPGNQWFQRDIEGINNLITSIVCEKRIETIFYYGASMGAYGALLFSSLRKDGPCLAYGPNIILGEIGSHSSRYNIDFDEKYTDITSYFSKSEFRSTVIFGAYDLVDFYYFRYTKRRLDKLNITDNNIDLHLMDSCHNVHQHLYNLGEVNKLLGDFISSKPVKNIISYPIKGEEIEMEKLSNYDIWKQFLSNVLAPDFEFFFHDIGDYFYFARIMFEKGDYSSAANSLTTAIDVISNCEVKKALPLGYRGKFYFLRAQSLRKNGDSMAMRDYQACLEMNYKTDACVRYLGQ